MVTFRCSLSLAFAASAVVLAACGGGGAAPASGQPGAAAQAAGFVPQSAAVASGAAIAPAAFPKPLPEPLIGLGTPAIAADLTKPIINDSGSYLNGAIIVGTDTVNGYGVEGVTKGSGAGLYGHSGSTSITSYGVYGFSPGGAGIYGYDSGSGAGVSGASVNGNGVEGATGNASFFGGNFTNSGGGTALNATSGGNAIYGTNTNGEYQAAIIGSTTSSYEQGGNAGVEGVDDTGTTCGSACEGGNYGLYGSSDNNGYGVYGTTGGGIGVYGTAGSGGIGVESWESDSGTSLYVGDNGAGSQNLIIADSGGTDRMSLDDSGNLTISGTLSQNGTPLISSPQGGAQIESVGDAQLSNGSAYVTIDPAFAKHLDPSRTYHVFLTPNGDSNGLYVTGKTSTGFTVRESRHGTSTIAFDYRIVGTQRHLAMANWTPIRMHRRLQGPRIR